MKKSEQLKKETKKEIREMVTYIINTDDKDVIESYSCTFDDIMDKYASEIAREQRSKIAHTAVNDGTFKAIMAVPLVTNKQ